MTAASSSSSKVTAEEMEKAMADLDDIYARIPDECKFYCTEAEEYAKKMEERAEKEKKKKKELCMMPPHQVQKILNYKCRPLYEHKAIDFLVEQDKEKYKDLGTLIKVCDTFNRHHQDIMRSYQEKIRHEYETKGYVMYEAMHEYETKGYVMYEATDEEEEEKEEGAVVHQRSRGDGGRRRHRPGVTKSAKGGVVKRLN